MRAYHQPGDVYRVGRRCVLGARVGTITGVIDWTTYRVALDAGEESTEIIERAENIRPAGSPRKPQAVGVSYHGTVEQTRIEEVA